MGMSPGCAQQRLSVLLIQTSNQRINERKPSDDRYQRVPSCIAAAASDRDLR